MNKKTRINTWKERIKYIKDLFKIYKDLKKEEINLIGLYIVLRILIHFEKFTEGEKFHNPNNNLRGEYYPIAQRQVFQEPYRQSDGYCQSVWGGDVAQLHPWTVPQQIAWVVGIEEVGDNAHEYINPKHRQYSHERANEQWGQTDDSLNNLQSEE